MWSSGVLFGIFMLFDRSGFGIFWYFNYSSLSIFCVLIWVYMQVFNVFFCIIRLQIEIPEHTRKNNVGPNVCVNFESAIKFVRARQGLWLSSIVGCCHCNKSPNWVFCVVLIRFRSHLTTIQKPPCLLIHWTGYFEKLAFLKRSSFSTIGTLYNVKDSSCCVFLCVTVLYISLFRPWFELNISSLFWETPLMGL